LSSSGRLVLGALPEPVVRTLTHFEEAFGAQLRVIVPAPEPGAADEVLYASPGLSHKATSVARSSVERHLGPSLELQILGAENAPPEAVSAALTPALELAFEATREIEFFTYELSERFEEINLLYSISETLGSTLDLDSAAEAILVEVRDVLGAKRGSLWVYQPEDDALHLAAEVGDLGRVGARLAPQDPDTITSMVFREGRAIIASRQPTSAEREEGAAEDSFLSVPIRYSPASGGARTVGVVNLIGRQDGGKFSAANQKLLAAIASQVGAAIENNRLVQESLSKERMAREMELAHDLQMKLLPDATRFPAAEAAGRVQPTQQVGGDFYQLFELPGERIGVMLGDVSLHGFPSALIMTLTMSAAGIYAREAESPKGVLRKLDDALSEELETTEMFLTVFYGVIDPAAGVLVYANAGHPHAFAVHPDGSHERLVATDPPVGFAGGDSYRESSIAWNSGEDLLLLFTDGLPDALTGPDVGRGEDRVLEAVVRSRFKTTSEIIDAMFVLTTEGETSEHGDDRTALVVRG